MYLSSLRLVATNWTDELDMVHLVTFVGVVSGFALGQSIFSRRPVAGFSASYGLFTIIWQLGQVFGEGVLWSERLQSLFRRLFISFENLVDQRAVTDPVLFLFLIALLYWILANYAGYTLTRHANAWRSILPMGVALFIVHIHDPYWTSRSWFLAVYIFLALVLLSRMTFLKKQKVWRNNRTHLPAYVGWDFLRVTLIAGAVLTVMAWTAPALASSVPPIEDAWQTIARPYYEARSRMSNAFASLRATVGVVQDYYGDVLPLGRGNTLTDSVVFTVEAPPRPSAGVRFYWRDRVYETWTGNQWLVDPTSFETIRPDSSELVFPNLEGRWEATFKFFPASSVSTIHAPPQPLGISRNVGADLLILPDETVEILRMQATPAIRPGDVYEVRSSLSNVTIAALRESNADYPDWIRERYLQVPDTLTRRTFDLAVEIAGDLDNPYDVTIAITQWLRENIQYTDTVPVPPPEQDIIDWMLFDLKQGFCNYYATAEILMLRSLGIPARMAVGYAQGERDSETNTYTVRQRDAHAWPEVYFNGIGWVEFEPTLNQRPLRRPPGDPVNEGDGSSASLNGNNDQSVEQADLEALLGFEPLEDQGTPDEDSLDAEAAPTDDAQRSLWLWLLIPGVLLVAGSGYAWYQNRVITAPVDITRSVPGRLEQGFRRIGLKTPTFLKRWLFRVGLPIEARSYQQINRSLRWLGTPQTPECTPAERAVLLKSLLPEAEPAIDHLLTEYQVMMYATAAGTRYEGKPVETNEAARTLRFQTWKQILQKLIRRYQEPEERGTLV
jgi:transglutaminase-like putative cysteine protease